MIKVTVWVGVYCFVLLNQYWGMNVRSRGFLTSESWENVPTIERQWITRSVCVFLAGKSWLEWLTPPRIVEGMGTGNGNSRGMANMQRFPDHSTRWGRLWDHPHEQHFACSPPVSRLITFPPTSWLLLPCQASPPGKVRGDTANPVISRLGRLRTSDIPIPLLVSSVVTSIRFTWLPCTT